MGKEGHNVSHGASTRASTNAETSTLPSTYVSYVEDHLARMHREIESTTCALEIERRRLFMREEACSRAKAEFGEKRAKYKLQQDSQLDEAKQHRQHAMRLEARLDKAILKLNAADEKNQQLQADINQLRKERKNLDSVYRTLQLEIQYRREKLKERAENADKKMLAIADDKQTVAALQKRSEIERLDFKNVCEDLFEEMEEQEKVRKEMGVRGNGTGPKAKRQYMVADEEDRFSDQVMYRRILKLAFLNTIQRRHIKQHQKNIEVFEQAFATIKSTTGISEIDEIVKIFVKLEERNFSLLTYVNQLNREIENTELRNRDLLKQLAEYRQNEEESTRKKKDLLNSIEKQIAMTQLGQDEKESEIEKHLQVIEQIRPHCVKICEWLGINLGPLSPVRFPDLKSEDLGLFLQYIERVVLLFPDMIPQEAPIKVIKPPPAKKPDRTLRLNDLPSAQRAHEDDSEDDDEETLRYDAKPFSQKELREAVERSIQRRRGGRRNRPEEARRVDTQRAMETSPEHEKGDDFRRASEEDEDKEEVDRKWRGDKK